MSKAPASGTGNSGKPYTPVCVKAIYARKYLYLVLDENNNVACRRSAGLIRPKDTEGLVLYPDYNLIYTGEVFL